MYGRFSFAKSCLHLYLILYFNYGHHLSFKHSNWNSIIIRLFYKNFNFIHPIKNIFFDNIDYIRKLDASGKARPCILDNVERSLLCHTCYLGFDQFKCTDCDNWNIIPHSCHSRFCNACGVKYAKQLAAKATSFCLDCPHRHIVFTIPEELRNWFRQDRTRLNLLFVASRNTISILTNKSLADKLKKKKLSDTHYIFKDIPVRNEFGMIATLHTFGRDLKWNGALK